MKLKWAQLSDIHHFYTNYETTLMRDKLIDYLSINKDKIDVLFITGDIAHRGSSYSDEVSIFLNNVVEASELTRSNIFIVPGNHDIKRDPVTERLALSILRAPDVRKEINQLDDGTYQHLLSGQEPFFNFYKDFMGEEYPKDSLHFVKVRDGFNVVHINTCLLAGHKDAEGNILVGLSKLYDALKQLPNNDRTVNIAIGHHTIGCIHNSEKDSLLNRFSDSKIDLYLNGHVHKATYHHDTNNLNETYYFTCGGGFVDNYTDPVFITGVIDTEAALGEVAYHRWNSVGEYWHIDNTIGRKAATGSYQFEINRLKKKVISNEVPLSLEVDEDEFKQFLVEFHTVITLGNKLNEEFIQNDVTDKFVNMLCSQSIRFQYDKCSLYFPIINGMMGTTSYIGIDKRFIIPSVIFSEYLNVLHSYDNGDLILLKMINNLFDKYKNKVQYSEERLKSYIRILIFWSIYECDIFNEDKRQKGVV